MVDEVKFRKKRGEDGFPSSIPIGTNVPLRDSSKTKDVNIFKGTLIVASKTKTEINTTDRIKKIFSDPKKLVKLGGEWIRKLNENLIKLANFIFKVPDELREEINEIVNEISKVHAVLANVIYCLEQLVGKEEVTERKSRKSNLVSKLLKSSKDGELTVEDIMSYGKNRSVPPQVHIGEIKGKLKIKPVRNSLLFSHKPDGGFWTSTFTPDGEYCSDWAEWLVVEYGESTDKSKIKAYVLIPRKDAKVYVIDSAEDYLKLVQKYPRIIRCGTTAVDWEKVAKDYDGVRLTRRGLEEVASPASLVHRLTQMKVEDLYGWDVESTVWFRDVFEKIIPIEKIKDLKAKLP
ncbi:MAG: hypothetical protein B6U95_00190 [Thermofilum sp. ex4484_82]|nr:MAG: hypothetical protein B6U95_00190 [Thermofilum sp. ex4484_82]OYT40149.1 MAG: hypothetical protein B6U96_00190 [Archaeoglobales archaeon ex4484_92]